MILGVKKENFIVYSIFLVSSIVLLFLSFILEIFDIVPFIKNLFISLGCGFVASILIAYFVDRNNEMREKKKIKSIYNTYFKYIPNGIMWVARIIVERFYGKEENEEHSFKECFFESIEKMRSLNDIPKKVIDDILGPSTSFCFKAVEFIFKNRLDFEMYDIFDEKQMNGVIYIYNFFNLIGTQVSSVEIAAMSDSLFKYLIDTFPQIKDMFLEKIYFDGKHIKNFTKIAGLPF